MEQREMEIFMFVVRRQSCHMNYPAGKCRRVELIDHGGHLGEPPVEWCSGGIHKCFLSFDSLEVLHVIKQRLTGTCDIPIRLID